MAASPSWRRLGGPALLGLPVLGAVWSVYLSLGLKYLFWLPALALALGPSLAGAVAARTGRRGAGAVAGPSSTTGSRAAPALPATLWPTLCLLAWLALSGLWSPAPAAAVLNQLALYALLLSVPLVGARLDAVWARRALHHFAVASAVLGAVLVVERQAGLPPSSLWHTTADAEGNQRIANSLLMALGAALALWHAGRTPLMAHRVAWAGCAVLTVLGLLAQDRRTGMFVLPLVVLAWALASRQGAARKAVVVLAIAGTAAAAWQLSTNVRARFDEGVAELQRYRSSDRVADSWGQRVRMVETTVAMIAEHPWRGHGLASWRLQWLQRTQTGTALSAQTTPHNEYLLLAQQAGLPALLLFGWLLVAGLREARRAGAAGMPALMAWTALAVAACFNVALRDGKFALPLLIVIACATAVASRRQDPPA